MFSTKYKCSCCNTIVIPSENDCPNCGSHSIQSPYSFWVLCLLVCLIAVVVLKLTQVYLLDHQDVPKSQSFVQVISDKNK